MFLLILFAFLAGVVTILSPCILPILPIVLSGSLSGGHKRPLGIVSGFILSFTFFTLALATIVKATGLSADALRNLAVIVIFFFGLSMLLPQTQVLLEKLFTRLSGFAPKANQDAGFFGGMAIGFSLGLVWAPCVGPILASVITLAVTSSVSLAAVFITLAYSVGSAVPMLAITYGGRRLLQRVPWLFANTAKIQKIFGIFMIATALAIYLNVDRQFQAYILQKFPQYGAGLTAIENNSVVQSQLSQLGGESGQLPVGQAAPDFVGGGNWINSGPLSLKKELKGKVVLVDFWTYSCINCIRTFPYLRKWYDTYKDQGFVIVGVHAPEFAFEHDIANVTKAVKDFGLKYPVVQDNSFNIWNAYHNQFWPAHYLIDQQGKIRYTHFGEGNYVETENAIRQLLNEKALNEAEPAAPTQQQLTPETYLGVGMGHDTGYVPENQITPNQVVTYQYTQDPAEDSVALDGKWQVGNEFITAKDNNSMLLLNFVANQVYLVMDKPANVTTAKVQVLLDGKPLPQKYWTKDMDAQGLLTIDGPRKYDIVDLKNDYGRHTVQLVFPTGVRAYAFTFG